MRIEFDSLRNPKPLTIVLSTRDGTKLGALPAKSVRLAGNLNSYFELTFEVAKNHKGSKLQQWDDIKDFKLLWIKEHDLWLELAVQTKDSNATVKSVSAKSLAEAELSQTNLYQLEINTENDIAREDYTPTVFFDRTNPNASLLHRMLSKTPHYSIGYVESSLHNIQRTFNFDGKTIYDSLQEVAQELGCYIDFSIHSDASGKPNRVINVYDLKSYCLDCKTRGEFDVCPTCGKTEMSGGFGVDTGIFVSTKNLTDEIVFEANSDSIKNCFKLETGDDLMTATVANCNANGSPYIWCISDATKADMPAELVSKIEEYDNLLEYYQNSHSVTIDSTLVENYSSLVSKYLVYNSNISLPNSPIIGFPALINEYYNSIDFTLLLQSGLMPSMETNDTTAQDQVTLLTLENLSPIAVISLDTASNSTVNSSVLAMARILIDNTKYQVRIGNGSYSEGVWTGNFIVTNFSNSEDYATSGTVTVTVTDNFEQYLSQLLDKSLDDEKDDITDIVSLFALSNDDFSTELKKYSLARLQSFNDCCEACINILIENGAGSDTTWESASDDVYNNLYIPYQEKLLIIQTEIQLRESEIELIANYQNALIENRNSIQSSLNFENYLGNTLWNKFIAYRREDTYSNTNYISDGLNNAELISNAMAFIETANKDLYDSAHYQHSITATLKNLLVIKEFEKLLDKFELGNFIRIQCDDQIYKIRLLTYEIDYDNLNDLPVSFSDVRELRDEIKDFNDIYNQTKSMATSYDNVMRQSEKGKESQEELNEMKNSGISMSNMKIIDDATNQNYIFDSHGMLFRKYISTSGKYSDEQLKIINSTIAITNDNWRTVKTAIGGHYYVDPILNKVVYAYGINGEVLVGKLILGEQLGIYNESATLMFNKDGLTVKNSDYSFVVNPNDENTLVKISSSTENLFSFSTSGSLYIKGEIHAISGVIGKCTISEEGLLIIPAANINGLLKADQIDVSDVITVGGIAKTEDIPTDEEITTITKDTLKTTNVIAENLIVKAANINGLLKADQIDVSDVITVGGIAKTEDIPTDEEITTITKDTLKTTNVIAENLIVKAANINGLLKADQIDVSDVITVGGIAKTEDIPDTSGLLNEEQVTKITNDTISTTNVVAQNLKVKSINIDGDITADSILIKSSDGYVLFSASGTTVEIGEFSIGRTSSKSYLYSGNKTTYSSSTQGVYVGSDGIGLGASKFYIKKDGTGKIGGFTFDGDALYTNTMSTWQSPQTPTSNIYKRGIYISGSGLNFIGENTSTGKIGRFCIDEMGTTLIEQKSGDTWQCLYFDFDGLFIHDGKSTFSGIGLVYNGMKAYFGTSFGATSGYSRMLMQINGDGQTSLVGTWYIGSGEVITSDINAKHDIQSMSENYEILFDNLHSVIYKYNDGSSNRYHTGFVAQGVDEAITKAGLTRSDFAGLCIRDENTDKEAWGLRYSEFISLNTWQIQKLKKRVEELELMVKNLTEVQ